MRSNNALQNLSRETRSAIAFCRDRIYYLIELQFFGKAVNKALNFLTLQNTSVTRGDTIFTNYAVFLIETAPENSRG
jgi:hypothetical protein